MCCLSIVQTSRARWYWIGVAKHHEIGVTRLIWVSIYCFDFGILVWGGVYGNRSGKYVWRGWWWPVVCGAYIHVKHVGWKGEFRGRGTGQCSNGEVTLEWVRRKLKRIWEIFGDFLREFWKNVTELWWLIRKGNRGHVKTVNIRIWWRQEWRLAGSWIDYLAISIINYKSRPTKHNYSQRELILLP